MTLTVSQPMLLQPKPIVTKRLSCLDFGQQAISKSVQGMKLAAASFGFIQVRI